MFIEACRPQTRSAPSEFAADYDEVMSGRTLYMQQRYYEPIAARSLSVDPVSTDAKTGGHFNRYVYAENNPYSYIDPTGEAPGDPFKTPQAAAKDAVKFINPTSIKENREYGGMIYSDKAGQFKASDPVKGTGDTVNPHDSPAPASAKVVGDYHTHGNYSQKGPDGKPVATGDPKKDDYGSNKFSGGDKKGIAADATKAGGDYKGYLGTPSGKVLQYDPKTDKVTEVK